MSTNRGHGLGWGSSFGSASSGRARGGRAGYAGRGGRGGRGGFWQKSKQQNLPDISLHPLGELIATLNNPFLNLATSSTPGPPSITDCQYVTSYNWLNEGNPTILVPGKPPLWTPLEIPRPLDEDHGKYYRDPNAARFPIYPTEPAVQALLNTEPDFDTSSVDVFACGSTLGNLLRFVRSIDKPFRFSVEAIGDTVFFIRKENAPDEIIDGIHGYGHTFPGHYTTWGKDVKGSETHQRVVQYRFGGLTCLVRYEVDGYLGSSTTSNVNTLYGSDMNTTYGSDTAPDEEDLLAALKTVSVGQHVSKTKDLIVKMGGGEVSQQSIFDLKTRSGKYGKQIDMQEQLPTLFIKQIPNFVVAYHNGAGLFDKDKIQVRDVRQDIQEWATANDAALKRMVALIRKIVDFAKANDQGRIEVYSPSVNHLEIRKQFGEGSHVLPESLRTRWADSGEQEEDEEEDDDEDGGTFLGHSIHGYYDGSDDDGWRYNSDSEEPDFTACSAEDCGYCGRCEY
ncbi:hypothetical protein BCR34DRAFT_477418 [Clohesyomyces aquaticus]|uniref:Geranylgeranyl pyrophosphate synthetase n=1 Tax=Clohesyomyces aquaticus TaxID=1231657 RepID=A0A1Y1ZZI3_9PLEO|nr:hypothetical protein BCR34DRAFT_477418 [Clohesyomyces aquaticus]